MLDSKMVVLITGDRKWDNIERIARVIECFPKDTVIVHGAAKGADTIAGLVAKELGMEVHKHHANWKKFGRAAGPIRNKEMYDSEKPDLIIAFHNDIENSKGTKHMLETGKKNNTVCLLVTEKQYFIIYHAPIKERKSKF